MDADGRGGRRSGRQTWRETETTYRGKPTSEVGWQLIHRKKGTEGEVSLRINQKGGTCLRRRAKGG